MKSLVAMTSVAWIVMGCSHNTDVRTAETAAIEHGAKEIAFPAADDKSVYADFYSAGSPTKKVVLMFHQARSNAGEYETIAPKIKGLGFDCIAVDQRSGGDMWNRANRTAVKSGAGDYMAAYKDLVGALKYAEAKGYTTIVAWGSSYSAALTLRLASENKRVSDVVVFSPGEYMDKEGLVGSWAKGVSVPTLFACTPEEWSQGRDVLFQDIPAAKKTKAVLDGGVHGSSTLLPDKSKAADQYLTMVETFLKNP